MNTLFLETSTGAKDNGRPCGCNKPNNAHKTTSKYSSDIAKLYISR